MPSHPIRSLAALLLVAGTAAGCSSADAPAPAAGTAGGGTAKTLEVTVTGTDIEPAPAQVDLAVGQELTVTVTSDHDAGLHAHGFEVDELLEAGAPATLTLVGSEPGVYEVELHDPSLTLFTVAVR